MSGSNRPGSVHAIGLALVACFIFTAAAQAGISGINTPVTSAGSITFDDTASSQPPAGVTLTGPLASPWNGALLSLPLTTDPNTLDSAIGDMDATFLGNNYAINISNVTLTQATGNTGFATLGFAFNVEFQIDGAGLPLQPTLYPNFVVNGTVQTGGFAAVSGFIDYYGVNTAGVYSILESVNYNSVWTTPGSFSGTAAGIPVNGTTPLLVPNTTLTLDGFIIFQVDPASISAYSVTVPEPATLILLTLAAGVALRRPTQR